MDKNCDFSRTVTLMFPKFKGKLSYEITYSFLLILQSTIDQGVVARNSNPIFCNSCCTPWFKSRDGVVKVLEGSYSKLAHTISYVVRCFLPYQETIIISDSILSNPISLDSEISTDEGIKSCAYVENMPISVISLSQFLNSAHGFLRHLADSPKQTTRVNFIIVPGSSSKLLLTMSKLQKELLIIRPKGIGTLVWEPNLIFIWPEVESIVPNGTNKVGGESLVKSWFGNARLVFSFDSSIFFTFMVQKGSSLRSQQNLFLSLWELYSVKGNVIIESVTHASGTEQHQRELCNTKEIRLSNTIEQVNSYIFLQRFGRRGNLRLVPIIALVKETSDWIGISQEDNGFLRLMNGSSVSMYKDMKLMLNFSEHVELGDVARQFFPNQTLKYQYRGNESRCFDFHDISLNQESMTPSRAKNAAFLIPTYSGKYLAFFEQPLASTIRNIVSAPFTRTLWITFTSTWFIIIASVYIWWGFVKTRRCQYSPKDLNFVDEIGLWTLAAVCQKSWYLSPNASIFKVILLNGSLMALVCYSAYSAMIVSFLTVKVLPVKSLYDLIEYRYKFTVHEKSEATLDLASQLIDTFKLPQDVKTVSTENEISHIFEFKNAFLAYPDLFYSTAAKQNFTEEFICTNVSSVRAQNMPYRSAMSVPKGSQFREIFSQKLIQVMERGLIHRYSKVYETNRVISCIKNIYDDDGTYELDPVTLSDVMITFLLIFTGYTSSCLILLTEKLIWRQKKLYLLLLL